MKKFTFRQHLNYAFDNIMARGTIALIGWLCAVTAVLIAGIALPLYLTQTAVNEDGESASLGRLLWMGLMRTLDPGTMGGDQGSPLFLVSMLGMTIVGIFVLSILIGIINSGISDKIDQLRKGRSLLVETDHTIIIGWSPSIFCIISELVKANESRPGSPCIAVLAEKDKVEMEEEIQMRCGLDKHTRVVCRSGNPIEAADLEIVTPAHSRSIILLGGEDTSDGCDADTQIIKTLLAILHSPQRRAEPYSITAEIVDPEKFEVAELIAGEEGRIILVDEWVARIMAQTSLQSGLSSVYTELLDYGGDEIYFRAEPKLVGKTFADAVFAFSSSTVIGMKRADGQVVLLPPMDTVLSETDELVTIAEDDDKIFCDFAYRPSEGVKPCSVPSESALVSPLKILVLGWNRRGARVVGELDGYLAEGSLIQVVADLSEVPELPETKNTVRFLLSDTGTRAVLESLDLKQYERVIVLGYSDQYEMQAADAKTLMTLCLLRGISDSEGIRIPIVSEMEDVRNRRLAQISRADDFIISDHLISLLMTQVSENPDLIHVFRDLLDEDGCEMYLKPAGRYAGEAPVPFGKVVEASVVRGEIAIGYRIAAQGHDPENGFGIKVNPKKQDLVALKAEDQVLVLAMS